MKVLFFTNMYPDETNIVKGIFVKNQMDGLIKKGANIDLLYLRVKNPLIDYFKGIFLLRTKIAKKRYDLIHAHYGFMGFICSFQRKVPFILTLHGSDVNILWQRFFSKIAYLSAKKVIVTNQLHKKIMGEKAVVVPTGIDSNTFKPMNKNSARQMLNLDNNKKYLLFPSSKLRKVKNYDLFNEVITILRNENKDYDELSLENLTPVEVNLIYNAADLLVLTSFSEGSPLVIREALACNLPIVSVNVGDVAYQIENIPNCVIASFNPIEIVQKIKIILSNHQTARKDNNILLHTIEDNAIHTLKIYKDILSKSI